MAKNYFDKNGNYINVENLSLAEIYHRGYQDGSEDGLQGIRPKGEWEYVQRYNDDAFEFRCSVCRRKIIVDCNTTYALRDFPFCHCGADMRKGGAE